MRYLILGDTHTYFNRVVPELEKAYKIYNFEAIIQVGDLCYLPKKYYDEETQALNKLLIDFVEKNDLKFYWIDGNHEDHSVLQHITDFNSSVHNIYGKNFIYQPRGSFIELENYILFFIGGAETRDAYNRIEGCDFFREEVVSRLQEDFIFEQIDVIKNLNKQVIVIAHTCPSIVIDDERNLMDLMSDNRNFINIPSGNSQGKFLDEVLQRLNPKMWFHGHYHRERIYTLPEINNGNTTFYSIGGFVSLKHEVNDRKFFPIDL